jgi:hypothetical protein
MPAPRFCPSCGAPTTAIEGTNAAFCPQCGGSLTVAGHTQINLAANTDNLLGLARTAALAGNAQEAYDYASRVLESDSRNLDAWIIKAESAGWLSTLAAPRLNEMIVGSQAALSFAGAAGDAIRTNIVQFINNVGVAVHDMSLKHVLEFPMIETWNDHIARSFQVFDAFDFALTLIPDYRQVLDNCLIIATRLVQGVRYQQLTGGTDVLHLAPQAQAAVQQRINGWSGMIRRSDPAFLTPAPRAQSSCFVVTATMGDESAFPVRYLRAFRDDLLVRSTPGRTLSLGTTGTGQCLPLESRLAVGAESSPSYSSFCQVWPSPGQLDRLPG